MRDRLKVVGIDIIKGSVRSKSRRPTYALVRVEGQAIAGESEVSMFRLFRVLAAEQPDILAVDSLQEIAADQHELFLFLQALPPKTTLVQVTGGDRRETLSKVAARYNISFDRFDPFAEARTIAQVAALGAGAEVIAFENETEVVVSRHRSPGKGGWSQNRYARKIHGGVQRKGREIEQALVSSGLRYEKKETRAFGGCSRVAFRVFAARDQIPVSTYRGADVQIRISGKRLDRIRFRPLSGRPRYLIVGIDPGTTTAVAALDLDGNLLHLTSSRQMDMPALIESLYKAGKPLIIASDVQDMPYSVEKIRRAFSAVAFSPKQDMSVDTKMELTAAFPYANDHERDALAAALEAYRQYRNKFQNLAKRVPPGYDLDEVRARVIRGQALDQALGELHERAPEREAAVPAIEIDARRDERVRVLDGMVKRLRAFVAELQEELKGREYEVHRLQARLRKTHAARDAALVRDAGIARRDAVIRSLKNRLREEQRRTRALRKRFERKREAEEIAISGTAVPVKVLDALTRDALHRLTEGAGLGEGDVIYVTRTDGWGRSSVRDLADAGVRAVIADFDRISASDQQLLTVFREAGVPFLSATATGVAVKGAIGRVLAQALETALVQWVQEQEQREKERKTELVEHIFKEYKSERGKEVRKRG